MSPPKGDSMRLEELCTLRMQYREGTWLAPYGENEYAGFGTGKGDVAGPRIRGTMHWANHPRRREDRVWCPDLNGTIATEDGAKILISIKGVQHHRGDADRQPRDRRRGMVPDRRRPIPVAELLPRDRRGRDRRDDGGMVDPDLSGPERRRKGTPEDRGREVARLSLRESTQQRGPRSPDSPRPCARAA